MQAWPFWLAGGAIGVFVVVMLALTGKVLGVSSGFGTVCGALGSHLELFREGSCAEPWRLWFTLGMPLGGLYGALRDRSFHFTWTVPGFPMPSHFTTLGLLFVGGILIGYGSRAAGGCTSGHSIVGIAQGARSSIVTTMGFMAAGFAVTFILFRLGAP